MFDPDDGSLVAPEARNRNKEIAAATKTSEISKISEFGDLSCLKLSKLPTFLGGFLQLFALLRLGCGQSK